MKDQATAPAAIEINPAALLASQGRKVHEDTPVQNIATEQPQAQAPAAEIATPPAAEVKPEQKTADKPEEPAAPKEDWLTVLKSKPHTEILKGLGADDDTIAFYDDYKNLDPKMKVFLKSWKEGGDVAPYLKALNTDYSKMSAEEIMKHDIRETYPELSEADLDEVYNELVVDKYKLSSDLYTEQENKRGKAMLAKDSIEVRKKLEEKRQNFLLPNAPPPPVDDSEARIKTFIDDYKKKNEVVDYIKNKKLSFGDGADAFTLDVDDPEEDVNTLLYPDKWGAALGSADPATQFLVARILRDKAKTISSFVNHGKSLGKREVIDPIENASIPNLQAAKPDPTYENPAQAMAKTGKWI